MRDRPLRRKTMNAWALFFFSSLAIAAPPTVTYFGQLTTVNGQPTQLKVVRPESAPRQVCVKWVGPKAKKATLVSGLYVEVRGQEPKGSKGCLKAEEIRPAAYDPVDNQK